MSLGDEASAWDAALAGGRVANASVGGRGCCPLIGKAVPDVAWAYEREGAAAGAPLSGTSSSSSSAAALAQLRVRGRVQCGSSSSWRALLSAPVLLHQVPASAAARRSDGDSCCSTGCRLLRGRVALLRVARELRVVRAPGGAGRVARFLPRRGARSSTVPCRYSLGGSVLQRLLSASRATRPWCCSSVGRREGRRARADPCRKNASGPRRSSAA